MYHGRTEYDMSRGSYLCYTVPGSRHGCLPQAKSCGAVNNQDQHEEAHEFDISDVKSRVCGALPTP